MQKVAVHFFLIIVLLTGSGCIGTFLYHPGKKIQRTPAAIQLKYKDAWFENTGGTRLHGWWVPVKSPRYTVLFCHGNGGNISHRLATLKILHALNVNVFIFDYSGYGKSKGSPGEKETYSDALAAWDYIVSAFGVQPGRIIIWGRSLGGAVAVDLAQQRKAAALIVESSFVSLEKLVDDHVSWFFRPFGTRGKYRSLEKIKRLTVPICIIHSRGDKLIPFYHGEMLFKAAGKPKRFITLSGSHNSGFYESRDRYIAGINEFLNSLEKKRSERK